MAKGLAASESLGSPAWIRTKVYATTLSPMSYEPWFADRGWAPAAIRTTVHGSPLSALEVADRTPPQLVQWRRGHDFDQGDELGAEDIEVGMPFPKVGNRLM